MSGGDVRKSLTSSWLCSRVAKPEFELLIVFWFVAAGMCINAAPPGPIPGLYVGCAKNFTEVQFMCATLFLFFFFGVDFAEVEAILNMSEFQVPLLADE